MKNKDILLLTDVLPLVDVPDMDGDFNYAISANLTDAQLVAISIQKAIEPSQGVRNYEKGIKDLREEHAEKKEDGSIDVEETVVGNQILSKYNILGLKDPDSPYNCAAKELKELHKEDLEARQRQLEFLDKENEDFSPHMIPKKLLPPGLARYMMDAIFLLIEKEV